MTAMTGRYMNEAINNIDSNRKLNLLIDTLEQADIQALFKGETITVFRKFQLKRIEEYCASIHLPIHVQPCVDTSLNNIWALISAKCLITRGRRIIPKGADTTIKHKQQTIKEKRKEIVKNENHEHYEEEHRHLYHLQHRSYHPVY